jgi:uncharacterized membrane protein YcaP (DUF421 family)
MMYDHLNSWLGLDQQGHELTTLQMSLRAVVVFAAALLMLRFAHKRFFAGKNAVDLLLSLVLASTLSRAINGSAAFAPTLIVGFVLVLLHNGVTRLAYHHHRFGAWVKGQPEQLVTDGKPNVAAMKKHNVTEHDLIEDLRSEGVDRVEKVARATLERSGNISVVRKPHVYTVAVAEGVQTVRIELEG